MSYSNDPVADADDYYGRLYARQERRQKAQDALRDEFIKEILTFGPCAKTALKKRKDWKTGESIYPPIEELMSEALDHSHGPYASRPPQLRDVFDLLIAAAKGEDVRDLANEVIFYLAETWAYYEIDDEVGE